MYEPALVRVDDRLIHGQVVISWLPLVSSNRIVIVDDKLAVDSFLSEVVLLAAPKNVDVKIVSTAEAISDLSIFENVLLLIKTPVTALALSKGGLKFNTLIIGGIGAGAGRKTIYRNISVSKEEIEALNELSQAGVKPVFQILSSDRPVEYHKS